MTKKELLQLRDLLHKFFAYESENLSYSSYFEPEKVDCAQLIEEIDKKLTKEKTNER